jgi:type IV conjugative transfer system protein TraL
MKIPTTVDAPPQFFGKEMDEVAVLAMVFVVGIMAGKLGYAIVTMYFVSKAYKKFRGGVQENYLMHLMYWWGLYIPSAPSVFNPFIKEIA